MTKIIALANQKGGVGKTTTCVNLASALSMMKRKVLLIDFDPQGNATMGSGVDKLNLSLSCNDLLIGDVDFDSLVCHSEVGYDVLPSNADLTESEMKLIEFDNRELRLKTILSKVKKRYDYILIDCPPSLNMLTVNALVTADSVLVPMQCEYYALEGLSGLIDTIEQLRMTANKKLHLEGLVRTMYDARSRLTLEVSEQLNEHFGDKVYRTVIPRNVRVAEAPSHGISVISYDKKSSGASAYLALAGEFLRRQEELEVA